MKCPVCKIPTIVVEHDQIELDHCVECSGVWFDAGELALLLEKMQLGDSGISVDSVLTSPETKSSEKKRKCPICGRKMKKATVGHEPEVLIDACPVGHGLWFDKGEVVQLITQLHEKASGDSGSQGRVIEFLGEVFQASD